MCKQLENQVAVITGGNSGIGKATCIELAQMGAKVMILSRNTEKNEEVRKLIEEQGGYAEAYALDVTDREQIYETIDAIHKKHQRIDILVSNAGNVTAPTFIDEYSDEAWDVTLKTHLYGSYYIIKACSKVMKERKYGRIILMSSLAAISGFVGSISYATCKKGMVAMTQTLAKELGPFGITVNAIQPGIISTPMADPFIEAGGEKFIQETPVKRHGTPDEIANAAAFYCSPRTAFVTGTILPVDGGYILQSGMDQLSFEIASHK